MNTKALATLQFLICDNDDKYGELFERAVAGAHIELFHTSFESPRANTICERFLGSMRREYLDHLLIFSEGRARRVTSEYSDFSITVVPIRALTNEFPTRRRLPHSAKQRVGR